MQSQMKRLKEEADIHAVVEALGIQTEKKGGSYFLKCPDPNHSDAHPSAYYKPGWNNIYCNSCGRSFKAVDVIMMHTGWDVSTAANFLWELEGRPSWFAASPEKRREFSMSAAEEHLLGMNTRGDVYCCVSFDDMKTPLKSGERYHATEIDGYLKQRKVRIGWENFMTKSEFLRLVIQKGEDALSLYQAHGMEEEAKKTSDVIQRAKKSLRLLSQKKLSA